MSMFDDIEGDERNFGGSEIVHGEDNADAFGIDGTFIMKVELGNAAMQTPDDLARALELVAVQVRNRMEYPLPVVDANGNSCGFWEVTPYDLR